jgi:hypothetical protein
VQVRRLIGQGGPGRGLQPVAILCEAGLLGRVAAQLRHAFGVLLEQLFAASPLGQLVQQV